MTDDDELDWKLLVVDANDPSSEGMNSVEDVPKDQVDRLREWFQMYKTVEGEGINTFAANGSAMNATFAMSVIERSHEQWEGLFTELPASAPTGTLLSTEQQRAVFHVQLAFSTLSFAGSLLVVFSHWYFPELQKFAFKLVVMLAASDLGSGIGIFIGNPQPGSRLCTFQAVLTNYFLLASFCWTTVIALVLYGSVQQVCAWWGLVSVKCANAVRC